MRCAVVVALTLLLMPWIAFGQQSVVPGDVIATYFESTALGFPWARITVFAPDGALRFDKRPGVAGDILVDPNGTIHIAGLGYDEVVTYSSSLTTIRSFRAGFTPAALAMDLNGTIYVVGFSGEVATFTNAGVAIGTTHLPMQPEGEIDAADLSPDQCTLYYLEYPIHHVRRYDLCRRAQLPDLASPVPWVFRTNIRAALDGSVVIAGGDSIYVVRENESQARRIPVQGFATTVTTPTGNAVWTAGAHLSQIDLNTGAELVAGTSASPGAVGLAVYGVPRASATAPSIPALSREVLALLAAILALTAFACLRV